MGKCYSCFRAQFKPNEGKASVLPLVPKKPDGPGELPRPPSIDNNISPEKANEDAVLVVQNLNFHIEENATDHFTSDYDIVQLENPALVIRRGFSFKLGVAFNRSYDKEKDVVCLVFTAKDAKTPSYAQGTMIFCPVMPSENAVLPSDGWQTKLLSTEENGMELEVTPTPNCIIGDWILEVDTKVKKEREEQAKSLRYTSKQPVYILFNPWCKQDTVYMSDSEHRKEYVLNDGGLIWRGTNNRLRPTVWNYGQFEENVLQYPSIHIGFSNFCEPKNCILAVKSGTHTVCVCTIHQNQNMKLIINVVRLQNVVLDGYDTPLKSYHDYLAKIMTNPPAPNCYINLCEECPGHMPLEEAPTKKLTLSKEK